jgi:hypothetical protein
VKGRSVCEPVRFSQSALDDRIAQFVGERIAEFLGGGGRATLRSIVAQELRSDTHDPRPEIRRLRTRLADHNEGRCGHRPRGLVTRQLYEHGTIEERKRVVRAFVERLTLCGSDRTGILRIKKLPVPVSLGTGSPFNVVAGVRNDVQQVKSGPSVRDIRIAFVLENSALVPVGAEWAASGELVLA